VWSTTDNDRERLVVFFDEPISTDAFRLDIYGDNGNGNVALKLVAPVAEVVPSVRERLAPGLVGR
jgi:hypothetical protein